MTFVSFGGAYSADCAHVAGVVTCTHMPDVAVGASISYTITVKVASSVADGTTLSNTASVVADDADPVAVNDSDTETTAVSARADLEVVKSDSPDPVTAGENLTYTIAVTNLGPSDNTGFTVSDALPAGTSLVSASAGCVLAAGTVTCTSAGLVDGASVTWTLVVSGQTSTVSFWTNPPYWVDFFTNAANGNTPPVISRTR